MVTLGSTKSPNLLDDVFSPGLNRFWKKTDVETNPNQVFDTNISNIFGDLFDGSGKTAVLSGGVENMYYLSDFPLAQKPTFGDAKLVGANLFLYPTDIDRNETGSVGRTPDYKFFLVNRNIGEGNEGNIEPSSRGFSMTAAHSPIAAFSSNFSDDYHWSRDDFSNGGTSTVRNGVILVQTGAYIPFEGVGTSGGWAIQNLEGAYSHTKFEDRYVSTLPNGEKVIFVEKEGWTWGPWDAQWKPTKGTGALRDDPTWHVDDAKKKGYPLYAYEDVGQFSVNAPADTDSTFFDMVKVLKETTMKDENGQLAHGTQISFESGAGIGGTAALKMESIWAVDKSGPLPWSSMADYSPADKETYGIYNNRALQTKHISVLDAVATDNQHTWVPCRQRGVVVKKIPAPIIYGQKTGMDYTGRHGKSYRKKSPKDEPLEGIYPDKGHITDRNITTSEIQIDMKVDSLNKAPYFSSAENSWDNPKKDGWEATAMDARSIAVTLSTRPPEDGESFFDFYYSTRNDGEAFDGYSEIGEPIGRTGHHGSRFGIMTGFVIARPEWTDYKCRKTSTGYIKNPEDTDEVTTNGTVTALGQSNVPGRTYVDAAEQFDGSGMGYKFKKDGQVLIPFVSNPGIGGGNANDDDQSNNLSLCKDGCNWINGSTTKLGSRGAWNYWSIFGGTKDGDSSFGAGGKANVTSSKEDRQHLTFARAAFRGSAMEKYCVPLPDGEWMRVRIFLNGEEDRIYIQIEDPDTGNIYGRTSCEYNNNVSLWSHPPRYLSIWCNNFPGTCNKNEDGNIGHQYYGESKAEPFETRTTLLIDNVTLKNFNMNHKNASVSNLNPNRESLKINKNKVTNSYLQETNTPTYISFGFENGSDMTVTNGTYLLFNSVSGSSEPLTAIDNKYIRATMSMQGWTSGMVNEKLGLGDFESGPIASGVTQTGTFRRLSPFESPSLTQFSTDQQPLRSLSINNYESGGAAKIWDGTARGGGMQSGTGFGIFSEGNNTDIENFSYKGLMKIKHIANEIASDMTVTAGGAVSEECIHSYSPVKRENQWVSARITDYDLIDNTITVDDPSIFNIKEGIQYRIYVRGAEASSSSTVGTYQDVYLSDDNIVDNVVKIKTTLKKSTAISGLFRDENVGSMNLWISPKLAWLIFEVNPYDSSYTEVEERSIRSVLEVNRSESAFPTSTDYGVTFNEFTYNDGVYQNAWNLSHDTEDTEIINDTDFGYGAFDVEKGLGGELAFIKLAAESLWHVVDFSPAISVGDKKEGDIITTLMVPSSEDAFTKSTIQTTNSIKKATAKHSDKMQAGAYYEGVFRPFLLTTFEDELPRIEDFNVHPNENRPFYPEFTWNCKDDDIWYGFIIVDDVQINHQYHKSLIHIPLNTPKKTTKTTSLNPGNKTKGLYDKDWYSHINNTNSEALGKSLEYNLKDREAAFDPEGLAGWCHRFTGGGEEDVKAPNIGKISSVDDPGSTIDFPNTSPNKEMSLVMHIIPDHQTLPSSQTQYLFDDMGGVEYHSVTGESDRLHYFKVYIDINGYVNVEICPDNCNETSSGVTVDGSNARVILTSKTIVPMDGDTPTNIIVTLDASLKRNNVKLFINGKLEDTTGRAYTDTTRASSNRWPFNVGMNSDALNNTFKLGNIGSYRDYGNYTAQPYKGKMEEVVYYPICIYPVDVDSGNFIFEKPLKELSGNNTSRSLSAKLFVKDYHNIRGTTSKTVATAPSVAWRKSAPLFTSGSD